LKKLFFLFCFFTGLVKGAVYDPFLLETQLSLLPKIALLEKNAVSPNKKSPMKILIVYEGGDSETATLCIKILTKKFNGILSGKPLSITALPISKIYSPLPYNLVYALKMDDSQLERIRSAASEPGTVTALYDSQRLVDEGFLVSVQMERRPVILINAKILKKNNLSFPDHLLEMARILE